ncbi:hypothetical protein INR49_022358 [Caranx melampygus]|nr:hypothetical protein INR49_022358 [Caranx melampygus]
MWTFPMCTVNSPLENLLSIIRTATDMPPELPETLPTSSYIKMLAIMEQWEEGSAHHTVNTDKYLMLLLFKCGLDAVVFYLCCRKLTSSFLSMCSVSIVLADVLVTFYMAAVWSVGTERFLGSCCFLLAHTSATFGALPLPVMFLGLLDYCLEDTSLGKQSTCCKLVRNVFLTLLVWTLAVIYSFSSEKGKLMELDSVTGTKATVCEVEDSSLVPYFELLVFITVLFAVLPFWSRIPRWVKEADRLSDMREEKDNQRSDFLVSPLTTKTGSSEENYLQEAVLPPLWLSLTLAFTTIWIPYLVVSAVCLVLGYGVPAYISVNLLWLECTNSLLMGVVFWVKSKWLGPYSHLPDNGFAYLPHGHLQHDLTCQKTFIVRL